MNHEPLLFRALISILGLPESAFHSVVLFIDNCRFKTPMPPNVLNRGLRGWIEKQRHILLSPEQVAGARDALANHERSTDRKAAAHQHLQSIKQRGRSANPMITEHRSPGT